MQNATFEQSSANSTHIFSLRLIYTVTPDMFRTFILVFTEDDSLLKFYAISAPCQTVS
jgi:hypothetical protein